MIKINNFKSQNLLVFQKFASKLWLMKDWPSLLSWCSPHRRRASQDNATSCTAGRQYNARRSLFKRVDRAAASSAAWWPAVQVVQVAGPSQSQSASVSVVGGRPCWEQQVVAAFVSSHPCQPAFSSEASASDWYKVIFWPERRAMVLLCWRLLYSHPTHPVLCGLPHGQIGSDDETAGGTGFPFLILNKVFIWVSHHSHSTIT